LVGGAGLTLLLAAWVSASGPVGIFQRQNLDGFTVRDRIPGSDFEEGSNVAPPVEKVYSQPTPDDLLVSIILWGMRVLVVVVLAAVVFFIGRELWLRFRERDVIFEEAPRVEALPEVLLKGAEERVAELRMGTPDNAVVACWVRLEDEIAAAGLRKDDTRTSAELVSAVLSRYAVDPVALNELSALYREARFSAHQLTEEHRSRAADALTAIHVDLRRAAAKEMLRA
jgi:hypothetical protein